MLEESVSSSIPSIWTSVNSWFTPTVLFVLLNVMVVTIFLTSSLANQKQRQAQDNDRHHHNQQQQEGLVRSPSVLQRLRSINFYAYRSQEPIPSPPIATHFHPTTDSDTHFAPQHQIHQHQNPEPETETQHGFQQSHFEGDGKIEEEEKEKEEEEEEGLQSLDEVYSQLKGRHVDRTNSDTKPASGEMPVRLPARMRKSASAKSAFAHFEEEEVVNVVEARRPATVREGKGRAMEVDEEVDAKAGDFIKKFKQQLKLQRLDSILRYKEMITRGSGK